MSARRACRVLGVSRSAAYYRPRHRDDGPLIDAVSHYVSENPGHGFGLLYKRLRGTAGKTRLWRVYCDLHLNRPRRGKRRLPARIRQPLVLPVRSNETSEKWDGKNGGKNRTHTF